MNTGAKKINFLWNITKEALFEWRSREQNPKSKEKKKTKKKEKKSTSQKESENQLS